MGVPLSESQLEGRRVAARLIQNERERLLRFVAANLGGTVPAQKFVAGTLGRRLREFDKLRRGESLPHWLERKLARALLDWDEQEPAPETKSSAADVTRWNRPFQNCLRELMRVIDPRYRDVLRRVDFGAEGKRGVARDLGVTPSTMDVLLHRARQAVRRNLDKVCRPDDSS